MTGVEGMWIAPERGGAGFSLIELMIVVAIIGILASIAIPNYRHFQMKSKSSEGKVNLAGLRTAEISYFSEFGSYLAAASNPATVPGRSRVAFSLSNAGFNTLGWAPEGRVFFAYGVAVSADGTGFTADAGADIDGDGINQYWAFAKPDEGGGRVAAEVGCDVSGVTLGEVAPCTPTSGQRVF